MRAHRALAGFVVANRTFFGQPFMVLLVVAPEHRRKGVATELIRHVESLARAWGSARLFTSTMESNAPMHAVCAELGFVRSGVVENLDDSGDPEIIYFKRMSA